MQLFGSRDFDTVEYFINQLLPVIAQDGEDHCARVNQLIPVFEAISPRDEFEGMLAVQMISLHAMALEMMRRAMISDQSVDGVSNNVNRVTKLTRAFIALSGALDKHRGKGQQKISVEHVHVNEGGQAIVGSVDQGEKKR